MELLLQNSFCHWKRGFSSTGMPADSRMQQGRLPATLINKETGKTVLAKATFASNASWCQHSWQWRSIVNPGRPFLEKNIYVWKKWILWFLVQVAVWFFSLFFGWIFFFYFVLRSCFSEGKDCFIFSYGHDSGDQGGKANFIHVI